MKDAELEAFAAAVERHFTTRIGTRHILTPRDFALLKDWYAAGVSLATVLAGIDRAFEAGTAVRSLSYCRRFVDALASGGLSRRVERAAALARDDTQELGARLEALRAAIAATGAPALFERPERLLTELRDLVAVAREPNLTYLAGKLRALDELVEEAAVQALPAGEAAALLAEADRAAQRQGGRVDASALEEARRRYLLRRARDRFALPRVGGASGRTA